MTGKPRLTWRFFATSTGREVVRDEIHGVLGEGPPKKELGALMTRIAYGAVLPRDTKKLGDGLFEARLSHERNEYRLYFSYGSRGEAILLALAFHRKGGQGAQARVIALARQRMAEWRARI